MKCNSCTYSGLRKMILSGKPFQYFGDIPCHRCKYLKTENSEYVPASKEIPEDVWNNLEVLREWDSKKNIK